jgi:hypothetical protein
MSKHEQLFKLIQENPDLPIVPMINYEVCAGDDHNYWMGSWGKAEIDEYYCGDEQIYFSDYKEDLAQELIDNNYDNDWKGKSDEEMDKLAEETVNSYDWVKCIAVRIELP